MVKKFLSNGGTIGCKNKVVYLPLHHTWERTARKSDTCGACFVCNSHCIKQFVYLLWHTDVYNKHT